MDEVNGATPTRTTCPHCAGEVGVALASEPQVIHCPHCMRPIVLPAADGTLHVVGVGAIDYAGSIAPPAEAGAVDDLDGRRIRQVSQMRRGLYRTRSYWIVAAGVCLVAAGQLVWKVTSSRFDRVLGPQLSATLLAVGCLIGAGLCIRQVIRLTRVAARSNLVEPEHPPDLSSLSDGSQYWRNLERMQQRGQGDADHT